MARYPITLFTPANLLGGTPDPFFALHREVNRLFDDALRGGLAQASAQSGALLAPHIDVSETDKDVRIQAELPGVSEKDIEISLQDDVLTIRAEKKQEKREERQGAHVTERTYGTFQRSLRLPFPVSQDQVQAHFENGVLSVTMPKAHPKERTHRIPLQTRAPDASQTTQLEASPEQVIAGQQTNGSKPAGNDGASV